MKKLHRFFCAFTSDGSEVRIQDSELIHQAFRVLHLTPGERIILLDGSGMEVEAQIRSIDAEEILAEQIETRPCPNESSRQILLYCAMLKREHFEQVVSQATQLGVSRIVPIVTARTIKTGSNPDRLRRIATEAAEVAERARIPEIVEPVSFANAVPMHDPHAMGWLFDRHAEQFPPWSTAPSRVDGGGSTPIEIWIGPEGGWEEGEILMMKSQGIQSYRLTFSMLRAETAAAAAMTLAALAE